MEILIFIIIVVVIAIIMVKSHKENKIRSEILNQQRLAEIEQENERKNKRENKLRKINEMIDSLGFHIFKHYFVGHDKNTVFSTAKQCIKITEESANLVNTTKKPEVFFKRYNLLIENLYTLAHCEDYLKFNGNLPSDKLIENISIRDEETKSFIKRAVEDLREKVESFKTQKAKENNVEKFFYEMRKYDIYLSSANKEYLKTLEIEIRNDINFEKEMADFDKEMAKFDKEMEEFERKMADDEQKAEYHENITEKVHQSLKEPAKISTKTKQAHDTDGTYNLNDTFAHLPFEPNGSGYERYLLKGENKTIAKEHVLRLNTFLHDAKMLVREFPDLEITNVRFLDSSYKAGETVDYSQLFFEPYTKTGKVSKYPLRLSFNTKKYDFDTFAQDNIFGNIHYLIDGDIGKINMICWKNRKCYIVNCAIKNNELSITKVERNSDTGRISLYKKS